MIAWVLTGTAAALLILYLAAPPLRRRELSAARFFANRPPARAQRQRPRLGRLLTTPLFWLQLLVFALLASSVWTAQASVPATVAGERGLWLIVDTSASMTTVQNGQTRMEVARSAVASALQQYIGSRAGHPWCVRISTFDLQWREAALTRALPAALAALHALDARPLGTDTALVRNALMRRRPGPLERACALDGAVVVSDRPAPPDTWFAGLHTRAVWLDVGVPAANVGFTRVIPSGDPLTGAIRAVDFTVQAYGPPPASTTLIIHSPGRVDMTQTLSWTGRSTLPGSFTPPGPGVYTLRLSPGGAYRLDDALTVSVPATSRLRVDWEEPDRSLPRALGWVQDSRRPALRVAPLGAISRASGRIPTLYIGAGYAPGGAAVQPIGYLDGTSPLLADLNLDVVEKAGIHPAGGLPASFQPVLAGTDGRAWIARSVSPPAVVVPGLPQTAQTDVGAVAQTAFFNAALVLLSGRPLPPLYALTTPQHPTPGVGRAALFPGEGDTSVAPSTHGVVADLTGAGSPGSSSGRSPLWPLLVAAAALIFGAERASVIARGFRWG